jgi:hypothetical protein
MADKQLFANNAVSLLNSPITASATTLTVMPGHGAMFPQPTAPNEYFLITLEDQLATTREIVRVNGRSGDTFFNMQRGQEGTVAQAWTASLGADTLVDHRVTAETMRLSMELPELALGDLTDVSTAGALSGHVLKFNGSTWIPQPDTSFTPGSIDAFTDVDTTSTPPTVGQALVWNGSQWVPQTISNPFSSWIYGANTGPTIVNPSITGTVSSTTYSATNRTFKFIVTVTRQTDEATTSFICLASVTGQISSLSETVNWNIFSKIGPNIPGIASCSLDTAANVINLQWTNTDAVPVVVMVTRIQHDI